MNTKYVIKLVSPRYPNSRSFLHSVRAKRITRTSHPALARMFETPEKAQELIDAVAYQTGYAWEIHSYMGKGAQ
jgi:hypothetical protein